MRQFITIAGLLLSVSLYGQNKWQKASSVAAPVICHISGESGHSCIRPPEGFISRLKSGKKTSNLIARYVNVPDSVKPAIEYALEIWEYLLSSEVPIYIRISWEVLGKTTLGSCGATDYYQNFEGAPLKDTYFPVAAVEKITGKEISGPGNPDMIARFNLTIPWYTGTDGKTPSSQYDLVTIVLHEITHGLGFNGFFRANTNTRTASYGIGDETPSAYDWYVENFDEKRLTDPSSFQNNSNELYRAIVSNQLYSFGPLTLRWNENRRPRLYAPATYSTGSSIYHLNDVTYPYGNINSLMTSGAGTGEAIHSPGPYATAMIADVGWKHLYIDFQPLKDIEDQPDSLVFHSKIKSDLGIMDNSVFLILSRDLFVNHRDTVLFKPTGTEGEYKVVLKSGISNGKYAYYLTAKDTTGRKFTAPYNYPDSLFEFTLGPDQERPVISHRPVKYLPGSLRSFDVAAKVTDNLGVDTVSVIFYRNGSEFYRSQLRKLENDRYAGEISSQLFNPQNSDLVNYCMVATDRSKARNLRRVPETGTFSIPVFPIENPVSEYANDFETSQADFVLTDFVVSKEPGFDNFTLNTPHPYPSPEMDNDSMELTTLLRVPIIVQPKGRMTFDEVVLVEPGEEGSFFGNNDFYDFVIVEGSNNGGKNWHPLVDGYDSGSNKSWEEVYYKQIVDNHSTSAGTKEMFIKREIDLTGNSIFKAGDTLLIRFRLYSDPYAHGWGWTIDNLNIQNKTVPIVSSKVPGDLFTIWPNPFRSAIFLKNSHTSSYPRLDLEMVDITGRVLLKESLHQFLPGHIVTLDMNSMVPGIYFIRLKTDNGVNYKQRIIKPFSRE